ncbi:MAG: prepilin-type N-terminal cleavage/methylation domain-containing protein [Chloracidobacterium sp.]|nr:prepilin-type N-terminal cleavage/methylation domain-containing protein [Chloracidobacterium sp.]MCC6824771.1 prepilin-type N-terminal cleavage/methylation domain-containing protein [Acidobacteriota bacterium]MCO5334004.1 prepilin-type N-terminal cleavage/methylation domain-containing protein [Pyrinomonadaceae bacterium]
MEAKLQRFSSSVSAAIGGRSSAGFSAIELLVVVAVLAVVLTISIPYFMSYRRLYRSDDQAIRVMDLLREANQLAITRRRTMRFEIDLTDNRLLIIDEAGTDPDVLLKAIPLDKTADVRMDVNPNGVAKPNPPNYPNATYAIDGLGHTEGANSVIGHTVWAARFQRDGSAVNAAGTPISATLYIWPPATPGNPNARNAGEVRAITIFGGSSAVRYWKYTGSTFVGVLN